MIELKPCPFCGNKELYVSGSDDVNGYPYWYIICSECLASTLGNKDKEKAVEAWNRRAT